MHRAGVFDNLRSRLNVLVSGLGLGSALQILLRMCAESFRATATAKVVRYAAVRDLGGGVFIVDGHPANGIKHYSHIELRNWRAKAAASQPKSLKPSFASLPDCSC
jgi:hypothetical protein